MKVNKRIGIYGLAANPPTFGHTHVLKSVMDQDIVDEIWVMPSYIHFHGKQMAPYNTRVEMCEHAFGGIDGIKIKTIEGAIAELVSDYDGSTLSMLENLRKHQDEDYYLIIGQDNADSMLTWKNGDVLINNEKFIIIPRLEESNNTGLSELNNAIQGGFKSKPLCIFMGKPNTGKSLINKWYFKSPHQLLMNITPMECSSTMVRKLFKQYRALESHSIDFNDIDKLVCSGVTNIILKEHLYKEGK
jgi:nicotinate-nucleotide adenylyltransferase